VNIAHGRYQDLVDEVTRPTAWIPFTQDETTKRQTDTPNPAMPNPLCGRLVRVDRVQKKNGDEVDVAVIRDDEGALYGVWLFENQNGEPSVIAKHWREKNPPIGADIALFSGPLTEGATGNLYHPPRLAFKMPDPDEAEPASSGASDDDIPF
jgi:hypothetical protein